MTEFFDSRWVPRPAHVTVRPEGGLPQGFRAAGVAAQIKPSGGLDVALLVGDGPTVTSAARFTRSGVLAAPVLVTRDESDLGALRVIAANAGNANAATGGPGMVVARRMQQAGAEATGLETKHVAVCSTGVIGVQMDADQVADGIAVAGQALDAAGGDDFAEAIRTTDAFPKQATLTVDLPSGPVTVSAQAKGAGMIQPNFATMFCFVQTDAALSAETCDVLLGLCVKRSFDRISVDGQLSTNDTAILMASGASGVQVEPKSDDERLLGEAIDALLRQLALLIVRDGEGSKRVGRVTVRGNGDGRALEHTARAVANSPLVKAALHGGDPNWGRIAQAVGMALPGTAPLQLDIDIEGVPVCVDGQAAEFDQQALDAAVAGTEVDYEIGLGPLEGRESDVEVFFSDLSHEYVTINAEYTT